MTFRTKTLLAAAAMVMATAAPALAEGELNIFNWGNYTNPEVIKKFEQKYNVKVTITDYDSNDTALAKVRAGGHGFDMVVPSANFMPIWINEGLLLETRPDQMENFKNVDPRWVDVEFDKGRHYSVPWQWGTVGIAVNTKAYKGDIGTWGIIFDTPAELKGKVNVVPEMTDVIDAAIVYNGGTRCTTDKEVLKKARDTLVKAKPNWLAMEYSTDREDDQGRLPRHQRLEWLGPAPAPSEPGHQVRTSEGRLHLLHGQSRRPEGREERRERQAVPELRDGP